MLLTETVTNWSWPHMSHNHDENNVGKAYFGRAFAIEDEQKKKATLTRPEQTAELIQKLAYAKMILRALNWNHSAKNKDFLTQRMKSYF